jgi:hypothetical protein
MNRPDRHRVGRRTDGRRRVATVTGWSAAGGVILAAVFGGLFAEATPAASAAPAGSDAPVPARPAPLDAPALPEAPAPVVVAPPTHRHHSNALQPPTSAPQVAAPRSTPQHSAGSSSGRGSHASTGAS